MWSRRDADSIFCRAMRFVWEVFLVASGGSRGNAGRRSTTNANADGWITLPRVSEVPAPEWPLTDSSEREETLWERLWVRPQAFMWHQLMLFEEVALYVRYLVEAEQVDAPSTVRTLVRQHQELLGLSTAGLLRNHWRIGVDEVTQQKAEREATPDRASSRDRLKRVK